MKTFILITVLAVICQASSLSSRKKRGTTAWSSSNAFCSTYNPSSCGDVYDFTNSKVLNVVISAYVYSNDEMTGNCARSNVPFTRSGRYKLDVWGSLDDCRCRNKTCEGLIEGKRRADKSDCCGKRRSFVYGSYHIDTPKDPAVKSCVEVVGNSNAKICYCDPKIPETNKCFNRITTMPTTTITTTPATTITTTPATTITTTPTTTITTTPATTITTTPTTTITTMPSTTTPTKLCPIPPSASSRVFGGTAVQKCGTGVVRFIGVTGSTLCNGVLVFNPELEKQPIVLTPTNCWIVIKNMLKLNTKGLSLQVGNSTYPVDEIAGKPVPGSSQYYELMLKSNGCLSPMCSYNAKTMDKAIDKSSCYMESYGQDKKLANGGVTSSGVLNKVNMQVYNTSCVDSLNASGECFKLTGSGYSCSGDWGAPVVCMLPTGERVVYGTLGYQAVCGPSSNIFPVLPVP